MLVPMSVGSFIREIKNAKEGVKVLQAALDGHELNIDYFVTFVKERAWAEIPDRLGRPFPTFGEFAVHPRPNGLGVHCSQTANMIRDLLRRNGLTSSWIDLLDIIVKRRGAPQKNGTNGAIFPFYTLPRGPHNEDRTLLRLKRQRSDLYNRVIRGELPSAHKAAIEAGFVEKARKAELKQVIRAMHKLPAAQRRIIVVELYHGLEPRQRDELRSDLLGERHVADQATPRVLEGVFAASP